MKTFIALLFGGCLSVAAAEMALGTVFNDANGNGKRDADEKGIAGVGVSNGETIVETDANGRWKLPVTDDTILFVLKPRGWMTPLNAHKLPRFHYIHKPKGSPPSRYPGSKPTGPLPKSIDFPLRKQAEPDKFRAIFFGDPQPRTQKEIDYIANDVVAELVGTDAKFGVSLGDLMFDDLSLYGSLNRTVALIGIPWYNLIGNHDLNFEAKLDRYSDETFERVYGPPYYSYDYGKVHFIVLDNVEWYHDEVRKRSSYRGAFGKRQLAFVRADLARVPKDRLVMLMMHIPLTGTGDRQALYRLIEKRPYTLSISGHTHWQAHQFIDRGGGWFGAKPHHHIINVTVSGSWWKGAKDERGIPHTTMRDGAPNGYSIITFDGAKATFDFKAARLPASHQLRIHTPVSIAAADVAKTPVYVNVFAGSEKSTVKLRVNGGKWTTLKKTVEPDPYYVQMRNAEIANKVQPELNAPTDSHHLWKGLLPAKLAKGTHLLEAVTRDMYGREYTAKRILRVE